MVAGHDERAGQPEPRIGRRAEGDGLPVPSDATLGVALLMAERTGDAVPVLDAAARLRPNDAGYLADAGFAQLRAGNLNAARERLALASELDADDPITQAYLQELARVEQVAGRAN